MRTVPLVRFVLSAAVLSGVAAFLTVYDFAIAEQLPQQLWSRLHVAELPIRFTPLALAGLALALMLVGAAARNPAATAIVAILVTAQMNGLRAGPVDTFDITLLLIFLVSVMALLRSPEPRLAMSSVFACSAALLLIALPHLTGQSATRFVIGLFGLARAALIALIVFNLIRDRDTLHFLLKALIVVAFISALVAIAQFFAAYFGLAYFTLLDPPESAWKPTPIGFVMRASGLSITAQHLSGFLVFALPLAAWRATDGWRIVDLTVLVTIIAGIAVTWNMGAILVAALIGSVFPFFRWPNLTVHFGVGYAAAVALLWRLGGIEWLYSTLYTAGVAKGTSQRSTLFEIGLEKVQRDMLFGTGPQGFADFSTNFWRRPVHNAFMQAFTELGILGALVFVALLLYLLLMLLAALWQAPSSDQPVLRCLTLIWLGMVLLMNSEPMLDHANTWLFLSIISAGVSIQWINRRSSTAGQLATPPARTGLPRAT